MNQAEDLLSLPRRKIYSQEQRHAIRSHVMQRVRQAEQAQGKKRPSGRENSKRPVDKARSRSSDSDSSAMNDYASSPLPITIKQEPRDIKSDLLIDLESEKITAVGTPVKHSPMKLNISPAVHEFDPFNTLPTNGLPHKSSESLLSYCE